MKNILSFPLLKEQEVAVLRADKMTGQVLDENYTLYLKNSNAIAFSIFNNLEEAIDFIKENSQKERNIEFYIFNKEEKIIYSSIS